MPSNRPSLPPEWYGYPKDAPPPRIVETRVRCLDCNLHVANPNNPEVGMGRCKIGLIGQYPAALHYCRDFVPAKGKP